MEFTFGIITNGLSENYVNLLIKSIQKQNIPNYEIIIVGGTDVYKDIVHIPFDETIKPNWITKKKNLICQNATYENLVLLHDYIELCDGWYKGFLEFGNNFDICVTKIINQDGTRFRDYCIFPYGDNNPFRNNALLPYDYISTPDLSKILYISVTYYIIKKNLAKKCPLDERLVWGQGEDVLLSKQLINYNVIIKCNMYSTVKFNKLKISCNWEKELTDEQLLLIKSYDSNDFEKINLIQQNELKRYIYTSAGIII